MSKNDYRSFFAECKQYLKLSQFCTAAGIDKSRFYVFMRGEQHNYLISLDKLRTMYNLIQQFCDNIA